jgi:hypothetical protein
LRFLELAEALNVPVAVVTDNDGDVAAVDRKYADYKDSSIVSLCFDLTEDVGPLTIKDKPFNYNTLEPKILKVNDRATLNTIFGITVDTDDELHIFMRRNKTECALAIFNATTKITYPEYIQQAIGP